MTDAVIADGGAPAPADVSGAPIPDQAVGAGNPLSSTGPTVEKPAEPEKPSATVQEAIQKANAKLAAKTAEKDADKPVAKANEPAKADGKPDVKPEAKVEPKADAQPRGDKGQFAPKTPAEEKPSTAPKWIPAERSQKWDAVDPELKADITGYNDRREREYSQGIEKYRKSAERDAALDEFHKLAESQGTTVQNALRNYIGLEQHLRRDLIGGLEQIITNANVKTPDGRVLTLRDIAGHVMGQTPDQNASRADSTIAELRNELATLKAQIGGVTQSIQQQHATNTLSQVEAFAKAHDRFDELSEAIQEEIKHGYSLEEAYSRAERLNPAAQKAPSEQPLNPAKAETPPLNPAGSKSITGAPSSGSSPATSDNKPVPTIEESLKRAFAKAKAA